MDTVSKILLSIAITILGNHVVLSSTGSCKEPMLAECSCGETMYISKKQFVVNCTNVGFNNTKPLEKLPNNTQILIFTGNNVTELPANVFGTQNNSHLHVLDMTNNNIKVIHGKAFHKVSTVERLILNHNELTTFDEHFRVFSNFENLLELHLTNAFMDNSVNLSSHLHTVFLNSDLVKLRKLHLEQNEIRSFKDDPNVFCSLNSLMDLHLGNNKLEHIRFKLDCLHHLRFLDLEGNNIVYLTKDELSQVDVFPKRKTNFTIDLSNNPFSCGYPIEEFFSWLNETKVEVHNKNKLKCKHDVHIPEEPLFLNAAGRVCHPRAKASSPPQPGSDGTVLFLTLLLLLSVGLLIYTNLEPIKKGLLPYFLSLSRKVHYTTIGKNEAHEMEV